MLQKFAVYLVVTLFHNRASDFHPEDAHLNVPESDCSYGGFPQSAQYVQLIDCTKLTSCFVIPQTVQFTVY
jgi:hypothetical protein